VGAPYSTPKITGVFKSKRTVNSTDKREGKYVAGVCRKYLMEKALG
jgi:hypothetical protein